VIKWKVCVAERQTDLCDVCNIVLGHESVRSRRVVNACSIDGSNDDLTASKCP
jgi:hypothetical protein